MYVETVLYDSFKKPPNEPASKRRFLCEILSLTMLCLFFLRILVILDSVLLSMMFLIRSVEIRLFKDLSKDPLQKIDVNDQGISLYFRDMSFHISVLFNQFQFTSGC